MTRTETAIRSTLPNMRSYDTDEHLFVSNRLPLHELNAVLLSERLANANKSPCTAQVDGPGPDRAPVDGEDEHGARGRSAPLRRRAGIEDPHAVVPRHLRQVRMAVDDRVAARKPRPQTRRATGGRPGDVHHPDPRAPHVDDALEREGLLERRLVLVPIHGFYGRPPRSKLLEERRR